MNLPAISVFEVPSLYTARFFSAGLEGRSKKFRPEAFARILTAILEFFGGRSDDRFEGWFGPGVISKDGTDRRKGYTVCEELSSVRKVREVHVGDQWVPIT